MIVIIIVKDKGGTFNLMKTLATKIHSNQISKENKLDRYSKEKLNELKTRHNVIAISKRELRKKVFESFNNKNSKDEIYLGMISKNTIDRIKEEVTGIKKSEIDKLFDENKNYDLSISQDVIRHIKKPSMTIDDVLEIIEKIDEIVILFDDVQRTIYEKGKQKNNALRFKKSFKDGTYYALVLLCKKKSTFNTQTVFMKKIDFINKKRNQSNYCL